MGMRPNVRDGELLGSRRSLHDTIAFVWELSVRMAYWWCSSEHPDVLPERVLLGMQVVSLLNKLGNMEEQRAGRTLVIDQDI